MKKNTKIAAVVSAAALMALAASLTSFAASGWQEEDGTWTYYDKNGEQVTDEWEKSGENWFYLDESGEMAVDCLIEDDDNYYYVDSNGAMVKNQWVAIDNEDAGEDDQPDVWWYYFQANGKAYRNNHSTSSIFKKVINNKTYCFDENGRMQYGWVSADDGTTNYDDTAWQECDYYFGDENDGAMSTGWREIALTNVEDAEDDQPGDSYWDEDQVRWFWFKSSGKKQTDKTNKAINGKKYGFDEYGRMIADWYAATVDDAESALSRRGSDSDASASDAYEYARTFSYYSSPEDGARYTKGWFKVVPGYYLNYSDYDDANNRWYYADGNGHIYAGQIKSIKGKKYAFDLKGGMISGLAILRVDSSNNILEYVDSEDAYDTEDSFDEFVAANVATSENLNNTESKYAVYYFSDDEDHDGTMKTGTQRVSLDGDAFTFDFKDSGTAKGQGVNGLDNKKYYLGGKLLCADSDNKIEIVCTDDTADNYLSTYTVSEFIELMGMTREDVDVKTGSAPKDSTVYVYDDKDQDYAISGYAVVNTSGSVVKSGTKKDGDSFKVVVSGNKIQQIYVEE